MIVVMFIFASFGVQIVGGKLAACNDPTVITRVRQTSIFGTVHYLNAASHLISRTTARAFSGKKFL